MASTFALAPNPKWYIADMVGRPLAGGYLSTFFSIDKTALRPVFQDINGTQPWPYVNIPNTTIQGILFDENGSQGPFYWEIDSPTNPDFYYIEVRDSAGVLQWTIDNFLPPSGGGGGGGTTPVQVDNLVANNVMWRNIGASASPIGVTKLKLAPGAHQGFSNNIANSAGVYTGSDIYFLKNNTAATDTLTFTTFASNASSLSGDVTPVEYLNYNCTVLGAGETVKCVQFPIIQNVYNLAGQQAVITIWLRSNAGNANVTLQWYQFFGNGGSPHVDAITNIQTIVATGGWSQSRVTANIPALPGGAVIGTCGNDGLFLRVSYPFGVTCNIDFTKPAVYLGTQAPTLEFETYDSIATVIDSSRTGDIRTTLDNSWLGASNVCPYGWVFMNDGTIGSASSGATARAGIDTFPLYNLIWNSVSRTWAPIVGSTTGTAIGDFNANLPLHLTRALGRVFAGTLNVEDSKIFTFTSSPGQTTITVSSTASFLTGVPIKLTTTGALPGNLSVNVTYYAINLTSTTMRIASSFANALAGTAITFDGSTASGIQTVTVTPYDLGETVGEEAHTLTIAEMPSHAHDIQVWGNSSNFSHPSAFNSSAVVATDGNSIQNTGGGGAHNTLQPTTYMNVYIKL